MVTVLKHARRVYKSWKSLDPDLRNALALEAQRVRTLVVELGGPIAARQLESDAEMSASEHMELTSRRPRPDVAAELLEAVEALSSACVASGGQVLGRSAPRSLRVGGWVAKTAVRRTVPRLKGMRTSSYAASHETPTDSRREHGREGR
jgi:hypothetical protein